MIPLQCTFFRFPKPHPSRRTCRNHSRSLGPQNDKREKQNRPFTAKCWLHDYYCSYTSAKTKTRVGDYKSLVQIRRRRSKEQLLSGGGERKHKWTRAKKKKKEREKERRGRKNSQLAHLCHREPRRSHPVFLCRVRVNKTLFEVGRPAL